MCQLSADIAAVKVVAYVSACDIC